MPKNVTFGRLLLRRKADLQTLILNPWVYVAPASTKNEQLRAVRVRHVITHHPTKLRRTSWREFAATPSTRLPDQSQTQVPAGHLKAENNDFDLDTAYDSYAPLGQEMVSRDSARDTRVRFGFCAPYQKATSKFFGLRSVFSRYANDVVSAKSRVESGTPPREEVSPFEHYRVRWRVQHHTLNRTRYGRCAVSPA